MTPSPVHLALLGAILLAGVLRGFTGFGFALAAVPLGGLILAPARVVPVVLLLQLGIGVRDWLVERHRADWFSVRRLALGCLAGTPLGVFALAALPQSVVRLALGTIVCAAVAATWYGPARPMPRRTSVAVLAGMASGLCNGLAAMGGPPAVLYFLAVEPARAITRSSLMIYFALAATIAVPGALAAGLIDNSMLGLAAAGLPVMLAGTWIGAAVFRRVGEPAYRLVAAGALSLTAIAAIVRGLAGLL
jgi:uncharacterized membrane protein YfcA